MFHWGQGFSCWPEFTLQLVGPEALHDDRLRGRQALPQLLTARGRPVLEVKIQVRRSP